MTEDLTSMNINEMTAEVIKLFQFGMSVAGRDVGLDATDPGMPPALPDYDRWVTLHSMDKVIALLEDFIAEATKLTHLIDEIQMEILVEMRSLIKVLKMQRAELADLLTRNDTDNPF